MTNIYDFAAADIDGKSRSLSDWKGKVLMITNVASACGYTHKVRIFVNLFLVL